MKTLFAFIILFLTCCPLGADEVPAGLGFSGMAKLTPSTYILVQDTKSGKAGFRIGAIKIRKKKAPKYWDLEIKDWSHPDGESNDLEAICALPQLEGEFLAMESSYYDGQYGRIFHLKMKGKKSIRIKQVYQLPMGEDNHEGLACTKLGSQILLILGERGDEGTGQLKLGILDLNKGKIDWERYRDLSLSLSAPGTWRDPGRVREIGDLYIDEEQVLWAVATEDAGKQGPFRSIIYRAGAVQQDKGLPLALDKAPKASWVIDGFKVEALAGPTGKVPGSVMSFGSEEEDYGGSWRPLFPSLEMP